MNIFLQSCRMTLRDWRAGELRFLLLALIVAVGSLSSVGFFVDRIRTGLARDANQLLGADLVVSADQPVNPHWSEEAIARGLSTSQTTSFASMAIAGEGDAALSQLASVKAVGKGYPLRGTLKLTSDVPGVDQPVKWLPSPGTVWLDPAVLSTLHLVTGDSLKLGDRSFKVERIIASEPDRGAAFLNFAPRVLLLDSDLAATNLIQPGSRVTYRLLIAGQPEKIAAFQKVLDTRITQEKIRGVRLESLESGRPEMRATLDRAQQFLALVGLLSAMLAAVAIAMAARRFMIRHRDACAMMRCLGLTQGDVTWLHLIEFLFIGLIGSIGGAILGFAAHFVLLEWLGKLVSNDLPAVTLLPAVQAIATGLVLLIGFALPPILQLRNVPHNRVLRQEQIPPQVATTATYLLGIGSFGGLLLWQAGDVRLGLITGSGFLVAVMIFAIVAWLVVKSLPYCRNLFRQTAWRFALNSLQRRPATTVVQIVALSLGLMALLLLTVVRGDLIAGWRSATPLDAPNQFVINIQPGQKAAITSKLASNGVADPELFPMIRGRLIEINGKSIDSTTFSEDRAKRLVEREFNLSTMLTIPVQNTITAGHWLDDRQSQASVEEGLAKTLNLKLGDDLGFDIGGQQVVAKITSLRKLDWGSMRVNFFVIINPKALENTPQTFITSFHLDPENQAFINTLTSEFPNLTVLDVGNVLRQIQSVVNQVVIAVEFLFLFTLASGGLVLYAALLGSQHERTREAGLLRALGATRTELSRSQTIEFAIIGGIAGLLAAIGAVATGWILARFIFDFPWEFNLFVLVAGVIAGSCCALIGGWFGLRAVLQRPPLQTLREA